MFLKLKCISSTHQVMIYQTRPPFTIAAWSSCDPHHPVYCCHLQQWTGLSMGRSLATLPCAPLTALHCIVTLFYQTQYEF